MVFSKNVGWWFSFILYSGLSFAGIEYEVKRGFSLNAMYGLKEKVSISADEIANIEIIDSDRNYIEIIGHLNENSPHEAAKIVLEETGGVLSVNIPQARIPAAAELKRVSGRLFSALEAGGNPSNEGADIESIQKPRVSLKLIVPRKMLNNDAISSRPGVYDVVSETRIEGKKNHWFTRTIDLKNPCRIELGVLEKVSTVEYDLSREDQMFISVKTGEADQTVIEVTEYEDLSPESNMKLRGKVKFKLIQPETLNLESGLKLEIHLPKNLKP